MLLRIAVLAALTTLAHPSVSQAEQPETVVVTPDHEGAMITLRPADRLQIRLPAQFGTGFSWALAAPSALLKPSEARVEAAGRTMPGSPETQVFEFTAAKFGMESLRFAYRQPWLSNAPARRFDVTVQVAP